MLIHKLRLKSLLAVGAASLARRLASRLASNFGEATAGVAGARRGGAAAGKATTSITRADHLISRIAKKMSCVCFLTSNK